MKQKGGSPKLFFNRQTMLEQPEYLLTPDDEVESFRIIFEAVIRRHPHAAFMVVDLLKHCLRRDSQIAEIVGRKFPGLTSIDFQLLINIFQPAADKAQRELMQLSEADRIISIGVAFNLISEILREEKEDQIIPASFCDN